MPRPTTTRNRHRPSATTNHPEQNPARRRDRRHGIGTARPEIARCRAIGRASDYARKAAAEDSARPHVRTPKAKFPAPLRQFRSVFAWLPPNTVTPATWPEGDWRPTYITPIRVGISILFDR